MNVEMKLIEFFREELVRRNDSIEYLSYIIEGAVPKFIFLATYNMFLRDEVIIPVELLPMEEKIKLKDKLNETGLNFTNQTKTDAARILYTLNFINENT